MLLRFKVAPFGATLNKGDIPHTPRLCKRTTWGARPGAVVQSAQDRVLIFVQFAILTFYLLNDILYSSSEENIKERV